MMIKVLITGAAGHLGRKLFDYLSLNEEYQVMGLDLREDDHPDIYKADFKQMGDWQNYLQGIAVLVHLAADREPSATWHSAIENNMKGTLNLYQAAINHQVSRVVFASSNWLHGGYRFRDEILTASLSPSPVNAYGVAELFGEQMGEYFSKQCNLSVIALRIGWTQWEYDNQPGPHMAMGLWGQQMWLSDRDFLCGIEKAIIAPSVPFAVLNLMSDNEGMRWDIQTTAQIIGYIPLDKHSPKISWLMALKSNLYNLLINKVPHFLERKMSGW